MSTADELFAAYVAEHRAGGEADPAAYLRRASPGDREALASRIDAYLDTAEPPAWDEVAYSAMVAEPRTQRLMSSIEDELADLLDLVNAARLTPRVVAERLADELELADHRPQVRERYHELQSGRSRIEAVSGRVWQALAGILGTSVERVRHAAERAMTPRDEAGVVFARTAAPAAAPPPPAYAEMREEQDFSAVDAVFFDR